MGSFTINTVFSFFREAIEEHNLNTRDCSLLTAGGLLMEGRSASLAEEQRHHQEIERSAVCETGATARCHQGSRLRRRRRSEAEKALEARGSPRVVSRWHPLRSGHAQERREIDLPKGAQLPDPQKLFNARLDSNTVRAIDLHQDEPVDEAALQALILEAVQLNTSNRR